MMQTIIQMEKIKPNSENYQDICTMAWNSIK